MTTASLALLGLREVDELLTFAPLLTRPPTLMHDIKKLHHRRNPRPVSITYFGVKDFLKSRDKNLLHRVVVIFSLVAK